MYWEIHPPRPERFPKGGDFAPRGPRDFPRAKPEGNLSGLVIHQRYLLLLVPPTLAVAGDVMFAMHMLHLQPNVSLHVRKLEYHFISNLKGVWELTIQLLKGNLHRTNILPHTSGCLVGSILRMISS